MDEPKNPLNNPYHIQRERENKEAISKMPPMTREQFRKQSFLLKLCYSGESLNDCERRLGLTAENTNGWTFNHNDWLDYRWK